jgi:multicomponent Na+:H+ antiporter subunit B
MKKYAALLTIALAFVFFYAAGDLPQIGDANSPANTHVSPRYIENAMEEVGSPNLVTGVLADYRGYDTLGETTVIFIAGLATAMILRGRKEGRDKE